MPVITARTIKSICLKSTPYFIRDTKLKGFAIKVNPSGKLKFVAEVWHGGCSVRKTLGEHPVISLQEARVQVVNFIQNVKSGSLEKSAQQITLNSLFKSYILGYRLKPNTVRNYREVIFFYLFDSLVIICFGAKL